MTELCKHKWIPMIDMKLNRGSLGSQIGYACLICKEQDIRWPNGAFEANVGETNLMRLNKAMLERD